MGHLVGVDLGGTKIAAVLFDSQTNKVTSGVTIATLAHEGPEAVIERIANTVTELCQEAGVEPHGVGLGVPATIDAARGVTLLMPNLPGDWRELPITAAVQAHLTVYPGCPVWLINDARAFTLAEATLGAGKDGHTVACFTVGTGIGGGIAIGGRLHLGLGGNAGEFGHLTIDPNGPRCGCGNHGCLEALASGPAITAMGVKTMLQGNDSKIGLLAYQDIKRVTPAIVMQAAELGDVFACEILERAGAAFGVALSNVITLLSPDCVVIGGGIAELGDWILGPARAEVQARCHTAPVDKIPLRRAALGRHAGAMGAAVWAMQNG
jgi:glucokinase